MKPHWFMRKRASASSPPPGEPPDYNKSSDDKNNKKKKGKLRKIFGYAKYGWKNKEQLASKAYKEYKGAATLAGKGLRVAAKESSKAFRLGVEGTARGMVGATEATNRLVSVAPSPVHVFALAWQRMSSTLKKLIVLVFMLAILFAPFGIFYYSGWALGASLMFLLSLIYWVFVNIFNAIAFVLVSIINGITTVLLSVIIRFVESIVALFDWGFVWHGGRGLRGHALIDYNQIATVPHLLNVQAPKWQPWMSDAIIVKFFQFFGLRGVQEAFRNIYASFGQFFANAPTWLILLFGLAPIVALAVLLISIYIQTRRVVTENYYYD